MPPQDQIEALKTLYPEISAAEEGGLPYLRIEGMKMPEGVSPQTLTGLLRPVMHEGYQSRLFLSEKVTHPGKGINWNPDGGVLILGQKWWAVSWQTKQNQTLIQMVLDHLGAFRP